MTPLSHCILNVPHSVIDWLRYKMDEAKWHFWSPVDDDLCLCGAENAVFAELLNDGQSQMESMKNKEFQKICSFLISYVFVFLCFHFLCFGAFFVLAYFLFGHSLFWSILRFGFSSFCFLRFSILRFGILCSSIESCIYRARGVNVDRIFAFFVGCYDLWQLDNSEPTLDAFITILTRR